MWIRRFSFLLAILLLASCSKKPLTGPRTTESSTTQAKPDSSIVYFESEAIPTAEGENKVIAHRYATLPEKHMFDTTFLSTGDMRGEFIVFDIIGKLRGFKHSAVEWDGEKLIEKKSYNEYSDIENVSIIIDSYFTEGSPNDIIKILDTRGKELIVELVEKGQ